MNDWHALERGAVLAALGSGDGGLTAEAAAAILRTIGPNELPRPALPPLWAIVGRQFRDPLVAISLSRR